MMEFEKDSNQFIICHTGIVKEHIDIYFNANITIKNNYVATLDEFCLQLETCLGHIGSPTSFSFFDSDLVVTAILRYENTTIINQFLEDLDFDWIF